MTLKDDAPTRTRSALPIVARMTGIHWLLVAIALLVLAVAVWLQTRAVIEFEIRSQSPVRMQIFHSSTGAFSEDESVSITVDPVRDSSVRIWLPSQNAAYLRLDPVAGSKPFGVCELRAKGKPASAYRKALANDVNWRDSGSCVLIESRPGAGDPYLALQSEIPAPGAGRIWWIAACLLLSLSLGALFIAVKGYDKPNTRVSAQADRIFNALSRQAHRLAFVLMLVLGSLIAHALPPNGVPDEVTHLSKIAKIHSGIGWSDSGAIPVVDVPKMYGSLWEVRAQAPLNPVLLDAQLNKPLPCAKSPQALPTAADRYAPHLYLLPTAVLAVSCGLESTFGTFLTTARILNLILGALLIAIGVRCATYGKWALFVVALLPMTLSQVASISADSLTLALSFCFLGLVSGIAGGRLRPAQVRYWLPAIAVLLAFAKPGAAWILIAVVFCRGAYLREGQSFAKAVVACVLIPWIIHIVWTVLSSTNAYPLAGVDLQHNLSLLVSDPVTVASLGMNTLFGDGFHAIYRSTIGLLGWLDVPLSPWAYVLGGAALGASLWTNSSVSKLPLAVRAVCLIAASGSLAILSLPLYLYWTDPDTGIIQGLQGRYFLPTVAFVLVWCGFRATPVLRVALLALVLTSPLLAFDAVRHINHRYYLVGT